MLNTIVRPTYVNFEHQSRGRSKINFSPGDGNFKHQKIPILQGRNYSKIFKHQKNANCLIIGMV